MSSSEGATGPTPPVGAAGSGSSTPPPGSTPIGIGGSGAYIPAAGKHATGPPPKTITPHVFTAPSGPPLPYGPVAGADAGSSSSSEAGALPPDLMGSWRSLMDSLGVTTPEHLNRAVTVARLLRGRR